MLGHTWMPAQCVYKQTAMATRTRSVHTDQQDKTSRSSHLKLTEFLLPTVISPQGKNTSVEGHNNYPIKLGYRLPSAI